MSRSRRANAVMFGFDFQVNAAIVLMLQNIKGLKSLRLEGNNEDIDIETDDETHILAQAKSVEKSSSDFSNVRANLKKSLMTLSEGCQKVKTSELILITNSPNPFQDKNFKRSSIFYGTARRNYSSLPEEYKKIINNYIKEIKDPLNLEKFIIQILPFETDDDRERYKSVLQEIDNFIGELNLEKPGLGKKLHRIWKDEIFKNGTKNNAELKLSKKSLIWPMLVQVTDVHGCESAFIDKYELIDYEEIVQKYEAIINSCCERVEFFTKILYDYNTYKNCRQSIASNNITFDFIEDSWKNYISEFDSVNISKELRKDLITVIVFNVIRRRNIINDIKQGVRL